MWKTLAFALSLSSISVAWAGPNDPIISKAWVGESIPGQDTSTLQLNLTTSKSVKLISVSSPVADAVEIHSLTMYSGKMKLQIVKSLPLPERRTIAFGSKGLFLMMTGINKPLNIGDKVPLSLTFTFADKRTSVVTTIAEVKKMELSYKHYGPNEVYDHR